MRLITRNYGIPRLVLPLEMLHEGDHRLLLQPSNLVWLACTLQGVQVDEISSKLYQ